MPLPSGIPIRRGLPVIAAVCASLLASPLRAEITFDAPFLANVGGVFPRGVAVGDLDGDGRPDLVTPYSWTNGDEVTLTFGNGDGSFGPPIDWTCGLEPQKVAIGDVNGDGLLDIVTANKRSPGLSLLINAGGGTFPTHLEYATPALGQTQTLAIADVDGDGRGDVLFSTPGSTTLSIFPGRADGTLGTRVDLPGVGFQFAADFDHDGRPDLVGTAFNVNDPVWTVRLHTSGFSFRAPLQIDPGIRYPSSLLFAGAGDFDEDGDLDLLYDVTLYPSTPELGICLGNGDGTFGAARFFPGAIAPRRLVVGDFDGDGDLDAVANNTTGTSSGGAVSLWRGLGDGTFGGPRIFPALNDQLATAVSDVNGDGRSDVVASSWSGCAVGVSLGLASGELGKQHRFPFTTAPGGGFDLPIGDVDGNGTPDVVTQTNAYDSLAVLLNDGAGNLSTLLRQPSESLASMHLADFDGDGVLDLVATTDSNVLFRHGNGDGTFGAAAHTFTGPHQFFLVVLDANDDGKLDLLLQRAASILPLRGNGDGSFVLADSTALPAGTGMRNAGDLDGDSFPDLVLGGANGLVMHGNGDFTFTAGASIPLWRMSGTALGDIDEDGVLDLVVAHGYGSTPETDSLTILHGQGDGSFTILLDLPLVGFFNDVAVLADFDRDGHLDLGTQSQQGAFAIWRGDGGGHFARGPVDFGLGDAPNVAQAVDMDGDQLPDLVTVDWLLCDVSVVMNRTPVVPTTVPPHLPAPGGLAITGIAPNPARGSRLSVAFTLPARGDARLEVYDVTGRRVAAREAPALEAGGHELVISPARRLAPGVYGLRLSQRGRVATARAVVVR